MKLKELFEVASAGVTSVQSIGRVEQKAFGNALIRLYKRDDSNVPKCVAKIKRETGCGWKMCATDGWKECNLPHFGQLTNIKTPINGSKTIRRNLETMLKAWGIKYDELLDYKD